MGTGPKLTPFSYKKPLHATIFEKPMDTFHIITWTLFSYKKPPPHSDGMEHGHVFPYKNPPHNAAGGNQGSVPN